MIHISAEEQQFRATFEQSLGEFFDRALTVFRDYGPHLENNVTNALSYAVTKGKIDEVLVALEKDFEQYLRFQKREVRGTVGSRLLGVNPTNGVFLHINRAILELKPSRLE